MQAIRDILSSKMLRKGLIFVVIVFAFQIFWFAWLSGLITKSEQLAQRERLEAEMLEHLDMAMLYSVQLSTDLANFVVSGRPGWVADCQTMRAKLIHEISLLEQLDPDPNEKVFSRQWRLDLDKQVNRVMSMESKEDKSPVELIVDVKKYMQPLMASAVAMRERVVGNVDTKSAQLAELRKQESESRALVSNIVSWGFFVNGCFAVYVVVSFLREITGRLHVLVENAHRLPKRLPLEKRVPGDDELSYLDSVLHEAAADLEKAFEHRKSLMQMVAHDLRSPLTSCSLALEAVTTFEAETLSEKALSRLGSVQGSIERVVALVNDLLTIDQLELGRLELRPTQFAIAEMANGAIQSLAGLAMRKNIEVVNLCGKEQMMADPDRITQVVVNYLSNAIKFAPENSTIELSVQKQDRLSIFSVQDEGPGMSKADQNMLFEKFFQTKDGKSARGFGLGLAICKLIVESHGGRVGVESEPGKGARFWFRIDDAAVEEITREKSTAST